MLPKPYLLSTFTEPFKHSLGNQVISMATNFPSRQRDVGFVFISHGIKASIRFIWKIHRERFESQNLCFFGSYHQRVRSTLICFLSLVETGNLSTNDDLLDMWFSLRSLGNSFLLDFLLCKNFRGIHLHNLTHIERR